MVRKLLIGQNEGCGLLRSFYVEDVAVPEVRACPAFIAQRVIVDPFQTVDRAVRFDKQLFARDLIGFIGSEVRDKNAGDTRGHFL